MAGKVLTAEDFDKSGDLTEKDTSSQVIPADQKFDQEGKPIVEEPEKETPLEEKAKGDEEPQPKPSDFKPKHKTWEETEKARLELERGFTEKSMRLSDTERELEKFRKPLTPVPTIDDQITEIAEGAIKEINAISVEYDTEGKPKSESLTKRDRDAAIIWAKANRKISQIEIRETTREAESHKTVVSKLYKSATDGGLKSDDELEMVGSAFDRTDPKLDLDTRITNAVESTKTRISRLREGFVKGQELDKKEKDELKVLGRGSSRKGGGKEEETKPATMSQQLADMNESRRLKKDDLY